MKTMIRVSTEESPGCEEECEHCGGEGVVRTDADDGEGHIMRGVGGEVPCICQIEE